MAELEADGAGVGDPDGRRLAAHRAALLSEAGRVARALAVLLDRAKFDARQCRTLMDAIGRQEQDELMRAHGRVEPRARFKHGSSHPLLANWPLSNLYIDESGKSAPDPHGPDVFALAGVALREEDVDEYQRAADQLKAAFFGTAALTFHEPMMRHHDGPYYFDSDVRRQQDFEAAVNDLVRQTPFVAFGVGIRKAAVRPYFEHAGLDPYLPTDGYSIAIMLMLERYMDYLAFQSERRRGRVNLESQGPREDVFHQLEYGRVLWEGSQWVAATSFQGWLEPGLRFTTKRGSHPTELADMFARDLFEWVRSGCQGDPARWHIFKSKIYCREDGKMGKFGLKIFPDSDIRPAVENHREQCRAAQTGGN